MKMSKKPMKIGRPSRRHSWAGRLGEWGREDRPSDGAEWTGSPWIASENELALGEDSVAKRCGVYVQLPQVLPRSCQVYLWGNVFVTLFKPNRAVAPPTAATGRRFWRHYGHSLSSKGSWHAALGTKTLPVGLRLEWEDGVRAAQDVEEQSKGPRCMRRPCRSKSFHRSVSVIPPSRRSQQVMLPGCTGFWVSIHS